MDTKYAFVSIVFYVRNIEGTLEKNIAIIIEILIQAFKEFELIFIDDASDDNSIKKIKELVDKVQGSFSVRLIELGYFHGIESAMQAGHDMAIGDFVYEFDDIRVDYPSDIIVDVYSKVLEGFDIVAAKPNKAKSWRSKIFYKLINLILFSNKQVISSETFRVLSRRGINRVQAIRSKMQNRKLVYASCGLRTSAVFYESNTINKIDNDASALKSRRELAVDTLIIFTDIAYRVSLMFSVIMAILMLGFGLFTVVSYFGAQPIEGWAPIMGLISAGFFGIFAILTVIVKYLDILLRGMFDRNVYRILSISKIK